MRRPFVTVAVLLTLAACEPAPEAADETPAALAVEEAWARPADTTGAARSAVYFMLRNEGGTSGRLVDARADVARVVEIHQSFEEGGVMRMRPVAGGVEVGPGEAVAFEPGGYHLMLIDLQRPLAPRDTFPLTLTFEPGGEREVDVEVREP